MIRNQNLMRSLVLLLVVYSNFTLLCRKNDFNIEKHTKVTNFNTDN